MTIPERREYLAEHCESVTEMTIPRNFEEDEIQMMRENLADRMLEVKSLEEQLKEIKDDFKEKMSTPKKEIKGLLNNLGKGFQEFTEQVYWFPNAETGMMEAYDQYGEIQRSRKMNPTEKQQIINFKPLKTGTND